MGAPFAYRPYYVPQVILFDDEDDEDRGFHHGRHHGY